MPVTGDDDKPGLLDLNNSGSQNVSSKRSVGSRASGGGAGRFGFLKGGKAAPSQQSGGGGPVVKITSKDRASSKESAGSKDSKNSSDGGGGRNSAKRSSLALGLGNISTTIKKRGACSMATALPSRRFARGSDSTRPRCSILGC